MSEITQIKTQQRKGRYNIYLDGQYAFPVSEQTLIQYRLAKGMELDDALANEIKQAEVTASANSIALDYISHQDRTVHEVKQKLRENDLPEDAIDAAVARLKELHYLDDAKYAAMFVRDNMAMGDKGPKVITNKLRQKGIFPALIEDALAEVADEEWLAVGGRVAAKAARHNQHRAFHDAIQKIRLTLLQKGFNADQITTIMAALDFEKDAEGEQDRLQHEAEKQWRLKHRYTGYDRKRRVKEALYRKGYDLDAIDAVLSELAKQDS